MKVSAIVYTSNTGFTAQYATLLSHQTGLPLYRLEECQLPRDTQVLFLGWLCAGKIQGLKGAMGRFQVAGICAVGMAPQADPAKLAGDNRCGGLPLFYLRGGYFHLVQPFQSGGAQLSIISASGGHESLAYVGAGAYLHAQPVAGVLMHVAEFRTQKTAALPLAQRVQVDVGPVRIAVEHAAFARRQSA